MLSYVAILSVMLCYAMLCYVMLCHAMLMLMLMLCYALRDILVHMRAVSDRRVHDDDDDGRERGGCQG